MKLENLDLYALKYFFDAVENKSLTKASEINFVTRSAVSQAILRLESWAGHKLTTHEKKNFRLTSDGETFYRQMKGAFEGFNRALKTPLTNAQSLRLGCSASTAESLLFPILKKIKIKDFHLSTGTSSQLLQQLTDETVNIAIYIGHADPAERNEFVIHNGSFVLASKNGQLTERIITTETRPEVTLLKQLLLKRNILSDSLLTVESWTLAAKLALDIGACCLIPDFLVKEKLKKISLKGFSYPYQVLVRHKSSEQLSDSEVHLLKILKSQSF